MALRGVMPGRSQLLLAVVILFILVVVAVNKTPDARTRTTAVTASPENAAARTPSTVPAALPVELPGEGALDTRGRDLLAHQQDHTRDHNRHMAFDVGFFNGDDTALLLSQGFNVVAVEANPLLWSQGQTRFSQDIAEGRLLLIHAGLVPTTMTATAEDQSEGLDFYVNNFNAEKSSFLRATGCRGRGKDPSPKDENCHKILVKTTSCADILRKHGVPLIMKLDVEGGEWGCVRSLKELNAKPSYIVVERSPRFDLDLLVDLGYDSFKYVNQGFTESSEWGVTSGPMGEYGLDCQLKWNWRNAADLAKVNQMAHKSPDLVPGCLVWADIHARHQNASARFVHRRL